MYACLWIHSMNNWYRCIYYLHYVCRHLPCIILFYVPFVTVAYTNVCHHMVSEWNFICVNLFCWILTSFTILMGINSSPSCLCFILFMGFQLFDIFYPLTRTVLSLYVSQMLKSFFIDLFGVVLSSLYYDVSKVFMKFYRLLLIGWVFMVSNRGYMQEYDNLSYYCVWLYCKLYQAYVCVFLGVVNFTS